MDFVTTERKSCGYCKGKGKPANSHWEKARDDDSKKAKETSTETAESINATTEVGRVRTLIWRTTVAFITNTNNVQHNMLHRTIDNACTSHNTPHWSDYLYLPSRVSVPNGPGGQA